MSDEIGKVVLEAIPKDEDSRKKLTAFLMRYSKGATEDSVARLLSQIPVILIKQISSDKGQALVLKFQQIGVKARFIAFSKPRVQPKQTQAKSDTQTSKSSSYLFKTAAIIVILLCVGIGFYKFYSDKFRKDQVYTVVDPNEQFRNALYQDKNFTAVETRISNLYDKENSAKIYELYLLYRALGKIVNPKESGKMDKILNEWCSKKSESHIPYLVRGIFYIAQKQFDSARKDLVKARELNPEDPNPPCYLIVLAREANFPREAMEEYFEQTITAYSNHIGAYLEKFEYLKPSRHGNPQEMFGFARKAMALSVEEPLLELLMIFAYEEDQKNSDAKENILGKREIWTSVRKNYDELIKKYQEDIKLNSCYAYHASMANKYDIASEQFDLIGDKWIADACWESLENYNQIRSHVYMKYGEMLLADHEKNDTATEYFLKSIKYLPSADGYYGLATAYWQAGSLKRDKALMKKAEAAMVKALELNPQHESANEQIFQLRRAIGGMSG